MAHWQSYEGSAVAGAIVDAGLDGELRQAAEPDAYFTLSKG